MKTRRNIVLHFPTSIRKIMLALFFVGFLSNHLYSANYLLYDIPKDTETDSLNAMLVTARELVNKNEMYKALELADTLNKSSLQQQNNEFIAQSYFLMGGIQYEIMDYEKSKASYKSAIVYAEKSKKAEFLVPIATQNLANIYYEDDKDYETALEYYKKGVELGRKRLQLRKMLIPLTNLAWTYMDLERFEEAAPFMKEIDSITVELKDSIPFGRSSIYLVRARNYAYLGNKEKALENFDKMYDVLEKEEPNWIKGKSYFYQYRAEMHKRFKDYEKAMVDLEKLNEFEALVVKNARVKYTEIDKIRFKIGRYEKELETAQREQVLQAKITENHIRLNYFFFIGISLLIVAGFFLYRAYQAKRKSHKALAIKNKELEIAKTKEETLNKTKSQFIATISHELRTPLYGIIGIASMFSENKNHCESDRKLVSSLKFSADYLLNLVNRVLTINKIDSDKASLTVIPTYIRALTKNIVESFEYKAEEKGIKLNFDYDSSIPKVLMLDSLAISEILINLIGNALKFTNEGSVSLKIKTLSADAKKTKLRFEVKDTGLGIPEDQKEHIFDEFSQVGSLYDNIQGTGLGLSIVKNLLKLMNSDVHCESTKGEGSTFYFDVELDIAENQPVEKEKKEVPIYNLKKEEDIAQVASTTGTILLVEDNKINQLVTKNLLKNIGYPCDIAENGLEAVEMMRKNSYELVLMDINMPVMDGVESTSQIRTFDEETPIIALTASDLNEIEDACRKAGMNDLVNKPLNKDTLESIILKNMAS